METNVKLAISGSIRYYIAALITFFVYTSLIVVGTGAFTTVVGYMAYNTQTGEMLYNYYYSEGEDIKKAEYEAQGIEVSTMSLRSELSGGAKVFTDVLGQVIGGVVTVAFINSLLYKTGDRDANLVAFGHKQQDKIRGLKIGLLMIIPSFAAWLIAVVAKLGVIGSNWYSLFRFMSYQTFMLVNAIFGYKTASTDGISWVQLFLGLTIIVIPPIIAQISYTLGYKRIALPSNLFYKKDRNK